MTTSPSAWTPIDSPCRRITADERAEYDRQGYLVIDDVFDRDELDTINREIDRLQVERTDGGKKGILLQLGLRSELTRAICREQRILTLIEDIVKPGIAIYSAKMIEKPAHDAGICHWHQDNAYYNANCESDCRMSIWLPLQDTDESNGQLWVVPGSHRGEVLPAEKRPMGHCNLSFADGREPMAEAVPVPMKAGQLLLFHATLKHRSLGNRTDRPRRTFIVSYQEASARRGNGDQHKILRPAPVV